MQQCSRINKVRIFSLFVILSLMPFLMGFSLFGKPEINVSCSINGYGSGECTFTNTGNASGKVCGKVKLVNTVSYWKKPIYSETICSGKVEESSSVAVSVHLSGASDLCDYSSSCSYAWEEQ